MARIYVAGIGYKPFDEKTREIILRSEIILASERLCEIFERYEEFGAVKGRVEVINNVDDTMNVIRARVKPPGQGTPNAGQAAIVLLASGDPMFCGIGRRTVEEFGKDMVEFLPDLSSIQVAFAKIKEPWDDAFLMSLHHGPDAQVRRALKYGPGDIPSLLKEHGKVAVLTDAENNPVRIADEILRSSALIHERSSLRMYVCARLGYPDEKITEGSAEDIVAMEFPEPNVVILLIQPPIRTSRS
jgi:precorrin-6Y C5,15-methyltransferase (decarboxylating)